MFNRVLYINYIGLAIAYRLLPIAQAQACTPTDRFTFGQAIWPRPAALCLRRRHQAIATAIAMDNSKGNIVAT